MLNTVFEVGEVVVSYEASGGSGTFDLFADNPPGGTVALQAGAALTLPATTGGKQVKSRPLSGIDATHIKAKFTPNASGVLKVYSATLRVRRIGVYLRGSEGEYFETNEIAINV